MKINNKIRSIIEWVIAVVLVIICFKYSIFSFGQISPIKAFIQSERTFYYGPSEIVNTIDLNGGKIYLCKYKDWFSANTVAKGLFFWHSQGDVAGTAIDYAKQVSYTWSTSTIKDNRLMKVYGIVNDPDISTIQIESMNEENSMSFPIDETKMFIFYWNEADEENNLKYLKGMNNNGEVIYEEKILGF